MESHRFGNEKVSAFSSYVCVEYIKKKSNGVQKALHRYNIQK